MIFGQESGDLNVEIVELGLSGEIRRRSRYSSGVLDIPKW